jgi:hypothetical protein
MGGHPQHVCSRIGGGGRHWALRCHGVAVRTRRQVRAMPDLHQRTLALRTAPRSRRARLPSHVRRSHARSKDAVELIGVMALRRPAGVEYVTLPPRPAPPIPAPHSRYTPALVFTRAPSSSTLPPGHRSTCGRPVWVAVLVARSSASAGRALSDSSAYLRQCDAASLDFATAPTNQIKATLVHIAGISKTTYVLATPSSLASEHACVDH